MTTPKSCWDIPLEEPEKRGFPEWEANSLTIANNPGVKPPQEYWAPVVSDPYDLRPKYEAALKIIQELTEAVQGLECACELLKADNALLRSKLPKPPSLTDGVPSFL